ncbi:MAG: hydrogenase 4 subunit F [Bacillota bacterium]
MEVALLAVPLAAALLCAACRERKMLEILNLLGAGACFGLALATAWRVFTGGPVTGPRGIIYIDALSAFIILIIGLVGFAAAVYTVGYLRFEVAHAEVAEERLRWYYFWFFIFIFTMLLVVAARNLGVMWVAIEATTLASALLVGYYNKEYSLEAAWKYIIICTVGIVFALFGTIVLYFAAVPVLGEGSRALEWTNLLRVAREMDPKLLKLAFIFILVGYGTKAGLAPMHTWLPDAHSQAPSPVSALLSGVLLNCAVYGIIRAHIIVSKGVGLPYSANLLLIFGLVSMAVSLPFIMLQHDFKRLLAYSSVEHIGIITAAVGLGSRLALYGAMLHLFNHAVTKSLLFFVAGNVTQKYRTKKMARIKGVLKTMPVSGAVLLIGALAITGLPPFSIFISEFTILSAGFAQGRYLAAGIFLVLITLIFAGIIYYVSKMAFGDPPGKVDRGETGLWAGAAVLVPVLLLVVLGLYIPPFFDRILVQVAAIVGGGI